MASRRSRRSGFFDLIFNMLTVLVVLMTIAVGAIYVMVFVNPQVSFNPYPPPTQVPMLGTPTPTNTPAQALGPTWTQTVTISPTPTITLTETPQPPAGVTPEGSITAGPSPTNSPFTVQVGNPTFINNIANDLGCEWMGVGGQVFDLSGAPITGLNVHLEGTLASVPFSLDGLTGSAATLGPAGYVFNLAEQPEASSGTIWLQLDDGAGVPLSARVYIETSDECDENLVLVNFTQVYEP
jgi:hypothetical protein